MRKENCEHFSKLKLSEDCVLELNNSFEILENVENVDNIDNNIKEKWENIKTIAKETKHQLIENDENTET
jgi:hypothetical protein